MNERQEVIEERKQLSKRLRKLEAFFDNKPVLDRNSHYLLVQQRGAMILYLGILEERIHRFAD